MKIYFRSRKYQIEFWKKNQLLSQEFLFYDLLHKARNTEYGKEHSFDHIVDYAGFISNVPIVNYEKIRALYYKDDLGRKGYIMARNRNAFL